MVRSLVLNPLLLVSLAGITILGCGPPPLPLTQATGIVHVNGQPADGVSVMLQHTDPNVKGNPSHPICVTDQDGTFRMTSIRDGDGVLPGEYTVAFQWLSSPGPGGFDMFHGAYNETKSKFRVTIEADQDNEIPVFELTTDPNNLKARAKTPEHEGK